MRTFKIIALSVTAILVMAVNAFALEVPAYKGYVNDYADMLSPAAEKALEARLTDLERTDSTQVAVLTIPSLEGDDMNEFSIRVVDAWKVGQADKDNGVLLLVSQGDRKVRIEVGYGLEGVLTDVLAGQIITNVIGPRFQKGDFDGGFIDGIGAISGAVRGEYTAAQAKKNQGSRRGVLPLIVIPMIAFIAFTEIFGRRRRRGHITGDKAVTDRRHGSGLGTATSTLFFLSMLGGGRGGGGGFGDGGGFGGFGGGGFGGGGAGGDW